MFYMAILKAELTVNPFLQLKIMDWGLSSAFFTTERKTHIHARYTLVMLLKSAKPMSGQALCQC